MANDLSRLHALLSKSDVLRVAILGIGNELNGDDAAGPLAARALISWAERNKGMAANPMPPQPAGVFQNDRLHIIDAGPSPESFSGPLRRFKPHLIILIDAAELHELPGVVQLFDWQQTVGLSASTHSMPPTMLAKFLVSELRCQVVLVGIQPKGLDFDTAVSPETKRAVRNVVATIRKQIAKHL